MPRRNLFLLSAAAIISLMCYRKSDSTKLFATYYKVLRCIETEYVEEVERRDLFEGSLRGMVGQLDEYSAYIDPQSNRDLRETLDQAFGGIGIHVALDDETKQLVVMSPLLGTPAFKAGILAGDRLLEIDGKSTEGFVLTDAVKLLRGAPGEPVTLTIQHQGSKEPLAVELKRELIAVPVVLGDTFHDDGSWNFMLAGSDGIGLLRVTSFGDKTSAEISAALAGLKTQGMKGLIIDLRNNPGGLLEEAVAVCDQFIKAGRIVSTQGRGQEVPKIFDATGRGTFTDFPIAVLVNQYSASASEIMAGCLQDHGRAVVVGQRSFGKGSVQNLIPLEGGRSALKLTTSTYYRPNGRNIHRLKDAKEEDEWGVSPNPGFEIKIETDELRKILVDRRNRDIFRPAPPPGESNTPTPIDPKPASPPVVDRQLQKAVEYLNQKLGVPVEPAAAAPSTAA